MNNELSDIKYKVVKFQHYYQAEKRQMGNVNYAHHGEELW